MFQYLDPWQMENPGTVNLMILLAQLACRFEYYRNSKKNAPAPPSAGA